MKFKKPVYKWYAIYTRVNGEKKILANLKEQNIECYLPLKKSLRKWSDRVKWIEEPLFRCYVFVKVSHIEFFEVLNTPGVVRYVSFGGNPQPIPDYQIENVRIMIEQQEKEIILSHENIEKGQNAEVLFGPFKGMHGEVVKICGNYRIVIRVEALGCAVYANISRDEVKALRYGKKNSPGVTQKKQTVH